MKQVSPKMSPAEPVKKLKKKPPVQNKIKPQVNKVTIDAADKVLGRLATEVAVILRGKNKPSFRPYLDMGDHVTVINAAKIVLTGKKIEQKKYYHHTGYLGHLKTTTLKELMVNDPAEVIKKAVWGMLPKNKLRPIWMKRLVIKK